jgi:EXPERA (EXPanded EBP superfamily)
MTRAVLPLRQRPFDILCLVFFVINIGFITYVVDLEQIVIDDPASFQYPAWPPAPLVDLVHWWGSNFDPPQMARPAWWRATIWIDVLLFGPFYAVAIYAYAKGREWIRLPSIVWGSVLMTVVFIICFEEMLGAHATPRPGVVLSANAAWFLVPLAVIVRMMREEHPFTRPAADAEARAAA